MDDKLITVAEAAEQKGVTRSAIYKAVEQGRLKAQRVLGRIALDRDDVKRWKPHLAAGWPKGKRVSEETKARISQGQKRRWAKLRKKR